MTWTNEKYRSGDVALTVSDVRLELYDLWNEFIEDRNHHIIAWQKTAEGHSNNCEVCRRYDERIRAVKRALSRFGAKPRR
jgi:hypothetical protein